MTRKANKLRFSLVLSILTISSFTLPASNIGNVFMNMPIKYIPDLSQQQRFELLAYKMANRGDSVQNRFNSNTIITTLDTLNNLLEVEDTKISSVQLKLFLLNKQDTIIGVINTVDNPIPSSAIHFYTTKWQPSSLKFEMPIATDWLDKKLIASSDIDKNWLMHVLETSFVSLKFSGSEIVATNHSLGFLSLNDKKQIKKFIENKDFKYDLKGGQFIKEK